MAASSRKLLATIAQPAFSERVMQQRYSTQSFLPFPSDINRDYFGAWLSGFADGEACFIANVDKQVSPRTRFEISLRRDDLSVLRLTQAYFQCGFVRLKEARTGNQSPVASYTIGNNSDLLKYIVPHFCRFPLLAKKARDFSIWKEAVLLCSTVCIRPRKTKGRYGYYPKWSSGEFEHFKALSRQLKECRNYNAPTTPLPAKPPVTMFGVKLGIF